MADYIRVVDIGGAGFRRVDVPVDAELNAEQIEDRIKDEAIKKPEDLGFDSIESLRSLMDFVTLGPAEIEKVKGIAYAVAGVIENHSLVKESPNAHFLDGVDLKDETEKYLKEKIHS